MLNAGDLSKAGEKLSELETLAGAGDPVLQELRARYESQAGERETNVRYATASVRYERARDIEGGQGLDALLEEMEERWREAEAAHRGQAWGQALSAYDAVIARSARLHELDEVRMEAREHRQSAGDPAAGEQAYREALAGLPGAATEARERRERSRLEGAIASAEASKGRGDWEAVLRVARDALPEERARLSASRTLYARLEALVREAEGNLTPRWRITATVEGREVPATIRIGGRTYTAPHTLELDEGRRYRAELSYESGARRYSAEAVEVRADWRGLREQAVVLEERRLLRGLREVAGASHASVSGLASGSREALAAPAGCGRFARNAA